MISTTAQGEGGLGPAGEQGSARGARREILTDVALLALLALFLYLPGIGSRDLQSVDEIRYSEVAREMIASESWLVPILNGETYMEKPALFFWLLSVPALIAGEVTEVGSRLVPVFFSILTLIFTYGIGRVLLGRRGGLWAAAILGTIFSFGSYSQHAVFDIPLTAATTLSLFAYVVWSRTGRHPTAMKVLCYVAMGFGVLLKGPIAILLPGLVMAADTVPRERWKALRTPHLFWGPLLTLGVFLLWFAPAAWSAGPEYLDYMFKRHIVDRSISGSAPHAHSIFYYLHKLIADALPWTPLLLPAAVCAWRALRGDPGRAGGRADAGLRLGSIWCAVMLVTLSLIASKRGRYLLPIYPGVALLLSAWFEAVRARGGIFEGRLEHLMVGATRHALALMVALGVVVLIAWQVAGAFDIDLLAELPDSKEIRHLQGGEAPLYGAIALEGIVLLSIAVWLLRGGNAARARLAVILVGAGSILVNHTQVAPSLSRLESPRPLAEEIRRLIDSGAEVALYALRLNADYLFYSGSLSLPELNEAAEIDEFLEEATPRLVVAKDRYFQKVVGQLEKPHEVICEIREGRNRVLLLGNREGAAMHRKLCRFHPARGGDAKVAGDGAGAASALEMRR